MGLGQLTPSFLMDLQTNMSIIAAQEYQRLNAPENQWQSLVCTDAPPSASARQRLMWVLDTAGIEYVNKLGDEVDFATVVMNSTEIEARAATAGLELNRFQLEDTDGGGVQIATEWSRQMGAYAAYWRQKQVAVALRNGGLATSLAYDGQIFFSTAHPVNPFDSSAGTYANDFTGSSSGAYPGAINISSTATVTDAFDKLNLAFAYIRSLKMPNGQDPRGLRPKALLGPPALQARLQQLSNAKFIAQVAGSGAAAADVEAVVRNWGIGQPVIADELGAGYTNGSDSTFYIIADQIGSSQLGAMSYWEREPFSIIYNTQMTDAELARANKLQWLTRGRNVVSYGHPYFIFRCRAA